MQAFAEPEGLILVPNQVGRDGQLLKVRGLEWPLPISRREEVERLRPCVEAVCRAAAIERAARRAHPVPFRIGEASSADGNAAPAALQSAVACLGST